MPIADAGHVITVDRRVIAEVQTTEETYLDPEEFKAFNALATDEEKYQYLIDHDLTVEDTEINSEMQLLRITFGEA